MGQRSQLGALLPATELRRGLVSEQCGQLFARETAFAARNPQAVRDGGGTWHHR
jgi:hypothetical protein